MSITMSHNIQVNAKSFEELEAVMAQIREKFGAFRFTSMDMSLSLTSDVGMLPPMQVARAVVAATAVAATAYADAATSTNVAVNTLQEAMDAIVANKDSVSLSTFDYHDVVRVSEAERRVRLQRAIGSKGRKAVQAKLKYLVEVTGTPAQVLKDVEKERHRIYEADLRWTVASA